MGSPAFEKRLKRRVSGRTGEFFAVCPPGLTALCGKELSRLGPHLDRMGLLPPGQSIENIQILPGGVAFSARPDMACLANLFLGTPTRILMRITRFRADHFAAFEKGIRAVDWDLYLPALPRIRVSTARSKLYHSDALAQRCMGILKEQAPSGKEDPGQTLMGQTLMIRGERDRFEISLDMSGPPLFKRGIKSRVVRAPLRETLAFAMLKRLDLSPGDTLSDPMAGSGTFSLEAAMIQSRIPPGLFRSFAFEAWPCFQAKRFSHARSRITEEMVLDGLPPIHASDLDPDAAASLEQTRQEHGFLSRMSVSCCNFLEAPAPASTGLVLLNPPYGRRLGKDRDITQFFGEIGKKLKTDYRGWRTGVVCPGTHLLRALDLPLTPMPLFHGGLDIVAGLGRIE